MMKVLPQQLRLYAVTDSRRLRGRTLLDTVAAALDGGATFVQLREKELSPAALLEEARALAKLCHARHVPFVVDDNVEVALAAGADGVHVGQSDMAARRARALLGPDKILGVSAHNAAEALTAQADGADYLGCGAAFVTGTKLDAHPVTAETMRAVTAAVNAENPLEGERILLDLEFKRLDDMIGLHNFDEHALYGYAMKLRLLERQQGFRYEAGKRSFDGLIAHIQQQVSSL